MAGEISFTLNEQDCVEAVRDQYRRRLTSPRQWGWPIAFLAATLGLFIYLDSHDLKSALYNGAVYGVLMLVVCPSLAALGYFLVGNHARRMFRQQAIHPESLITWSDDGLQNQNNFGYFAASWSDFFGWRERHGSFTVYINEDFYYLIPRRAISADQADDLRETLVRSGLARR